MANITKLLQENNYIRFALLEKLRSTFSLTEILNIYHDLHYHLGDIQNISNNYAVNSVIRDRNQLLVLEYIFDRQQHEIQQEQPDDEIEECRKTQEKQLDELLLQADKNSERLKIVQSSIRKELLSHQIGPEGTGWSSIFGNNS